MGSEAWARYGMNKARGIAQKQARFDTGEAEGREAALAAEAGADREVLRRAATGAAWREAEAATDESGDAAASDAETSDDGNDVGGAESADEVSEAAASDDSDGAGDAEAACRVANQAVITGIALAVVATVCAFLVRQKHVPMRLK